MTAAAARDEALSKFLALPGRCRRAARLLDEARRVERGYAPGPLDEVAAPHPDAGPRR